MKRVKKGSVKKTFFVSEPTVTIDRSYVYTFVFSDKTEIIVNGILTDSLHK